jgi:hypothetical protein
VQHIDRVLLGNLPAHIIEWLVEMLAIAVGPALASPGSHPPRCVRREGFRASAVSGSGMQSKP